MDLRKYILSNKDIKIVGITGGAGAGKTSLAKFLGFPTFHLDDYFIGDSSYRNKLLFSKGSASFPEYVDMCNMYNWWNWESAEKDLSNVDFPQWVVEGALLGTEYMLSKMDLIIHLHVDAKTRFYRLLERDSHKRDFHTALDRFMITEYSETIYYKAMYNLFAYKIVTVDENLEQMQFELEFPSHLSIPVRLETR